MPPSTLNVEYRESLYRDYFDQLQAGGFLHILVVLNSLGAPRIYVEVPANKTDQCGKVRFFFRKEDYMAYAEAIISKESLDILMIKRLDLTATEAAMVAMDLNRNFVKKGYLGIDAVTSILNNNRLIDFDIFWSKTDKKELL